MEVGMAARSAAGYGGWVRGRAMAAPEEGEFFCGAVAVAVSTMRAKRAC
jgi:hypothetical protein